MFNILTGTMIRIVLGIIIRILMDLSSGARKNKAIANPRALWRFIAGTINELNG